MRTNAKGAAYAAVGAADATVEKMRGSLQTVGRTARRAPDSAMETLDRLEKRGRKLMSRAGSKAKRRTKAPAVAMRRAKSTVRRDARKGAGSARAGTRTRATASRTRRTASR